MLLYIKMQLSGGGGQKPWRAKGLAIEIEEVFFSCKNEYSLELLLKMNHKNKVQ